MGGPLLHSKKGGEGYVDTPEKMNKMCVGTAPSDVCVLVLGIFAGWHSLTPHLRVRLQPRRCRRCSEGVEAEPPLGENGANLPWDCTCS